MRARAYAHAGQKCLNTEQIKKLCSLTEINFFPKLVEESIHKSLVTGVLELLPYLCCILFAIDDQQAQFMKPCLKTEFFFAASSL